MADILQTTSSNVFFFNELKFNENLLIEINNMIMMWLNTTWLLKLISFFEIVEQYGRDKFQSGYKPLNSNSLTGSPWKYNLHQK